MGVIKSGRLFFVPNWAGTPITYWPIYHIRKPLDRLWRRRSSALERSTLWLTTLLSPHVARLKKRMPTYLIWIMAINLRAPMLIIRQAVKEFGETESFGRSRGVVLNVGSINALAGEPNLVAYSASKGGLVTLSRNLANSLAVEKIRVNHLNVGWVTSANEIALKQTEGMAPGWENRVPIEYAPSGKLQTPQEIARHILFWISDESAPASGCVYEVEQYSMIGRNVSKAFE